MDCVGEEEGDDPDAPADSGGSDAADDGDTADETDDAAEPDSGADEDEAGADPCMRALVRGARIRSAELDDQASPPEWSEVEVVQ